MDLQPIQQEMRALMPPSIELVAGQVHVPLLYSLLFLTDYPNPDFAFRFLVGAPLVGVFASPALPMTGFTDLNFGKLTKKATT